jgi:hypothetical protein
VKRPPATEPRAKNSLFGLVRPAEELAERDERVRSPDQKLLAFVKDAPELGLWVSEADGSEKRALFQAKSVKVENPPEGTSLGQTSALFGLEFSSDGKRIYFQADGWGTSLALYSVEVESGRVRFIHDANGYQVIRKCSDPAYVGRLIILEHRYFDPIPTSAVDWYFLIDDRAKRHGIVGPTRENVHRFLANRCGVGQAPAPAKLDRVPHRLQKNLVCKHEISRRKHIEFLDGTGVDFFFVYDSAELARNPKTLPLVLGLEDASRWAENQCGTASPDSCDIRERCGTASSG